MRLSPNAYINHILFLLMLIYYKYLFHVFVYDVKHLHIIHFPVKQDFDRIKILNIHCHMVCLIMELDDLVEFYEILQVHFVPYHNHLINDKTLQNQTMIGVDQVFN